MNSKIPAFLTEKNNIVKLLIFTAVFCMVFINLYKPFGSSYWKEYTQTQFFLVSGLIVLSGVGIIALSRFIMYKSTRKNTLTYWQFIIWLLVEFTVISLTYSFITKFGFKVGQDFMVLFSWVFLYTVLILTIPYIVSWLYFALRDAEKVIQQMASEENFVDLGSEKNDLINFKDDKGILKLSVALSNILYIESADNYVEIYYLKKGRVSHFMLRNTLKLIEELYGNSVIMRCHRSYMVNLKNVKVLRKDKDGLLLELDIDGVPDIPVSKSYTEKILEVFSSFYPE